MSLEDTASDYSGIKGMVNITMEISIFLLNFTMNKEKTLKIAPRFMDVSHLENLSEEEKIKFGHKISKALKGIKKPEGFSENLSKQRSWAN